MRAREINAHFRSVSWAAQVNVEIWGRGGYLAFGCVRIRWAFFSLAPESNCPLTRPARGFPRFGETLGERHCVRSVARRPASSSHWLAAPLVSARGPMAPRLADLELDFIRKHDKLGHTPLRTRPAWGFPCFGATLGGDIAFAASPDVQRAHHLASRRPSSGPDRTGPHLPDWPDRTGRGGMG